VQLPVLPVDQVDGVLDDGQRLEAEKVELHQTRRFHPFHVELRRRHVRARVAVKRHQLIERRSPITTPAAWVEALRKSPSILPA
jgi:hypothetical protein